MILFAIIFFGFYPAISLKNYISQCKAIATLIDRLYGQYQMTFHLVSISGDMHSKRITSEILKIVTSPICSEEILHIQNFDYTYEVPYVVITNKEFLHSIENISRVRKLSELSIRKFFSSGAQSILLNFSYNDTIADEEICAGNSLYYEPSRLFQLVQSTNSDDLELFGCVRYQAFICKPEWKIVNTFNSSNRSWNYFSYVQEYKSFENCDFTLFFFEETDYSQYTSVKFENENGTKIIFKGLMGDFYTLFSQTFKANLKREILTVAERIEVFLPGEDDLTFTQYEKTLFNMMGLTTRKFIEQFEN